MKIKPMLGSFALEGIEHIESFERRALAEHRVPGLAGSYFQDLGTTANSIIVAGTRHGDEARDAFLNGIRQIFNRGEQTTFVADINTATDITEVVVEELEVAELGGRADSFRYAIRLRKYVPPPAPPAAGLLDVEAGILDDAAGLLDTLNTLDALGSIPNLGDPTPPLREALSGVTAATSELPATVDTVNGLLGSEAGGPLEGLPSSDEFSSIFSGVAGDGAEKTGVSGAVGILNDAGVSSQTTALVSQLQTALGGPLNGGASSPSAAGIIDQFTTAAQALPSDPTTLTTPLTSRLDTIRGLTSPEVTGELLGGISALSNLPSQVQLDPEALLRAAGLDDLRTSLQAGEFGRLHQWSEAVALLDEELAGFDGAPEALKERLINFLGEKVADLADLILPGIRRPAEEFAGRLDAAVSPERIATVGAAKGTLLGDLERLRAEFATGNVSNTAALSAAETSFQALVSDLDTLAVELEAALADARATAGGLAEALARQYDAFQSVEVVDVTDIRARALGAIAELRETISAVDLTGVRAQIDAILHQISDVIAELNVGRVMAALEGTQGPIREALDTLDAALYELVSLVRSALDRVRQALQTVMEALGTTGEDGRFHFHIEREIETFLNHVKSVITDTLRPLLESFRNTITQVITQVMGALDQVRDQIEAVKSQLQQTLNAAVEQLRAIDIRGTLERIRQSLDEMLSELAGIDFDTVVDSVVAQIEEMREQLRQIDTSALNDVIRGALRIAVQVVTSIDFTTEITKALTDEFDTILEAPTRAVGDVQARIDEALDRLRALSPEAAVAPLSELFSPLMSALDSLQVETMVAPLEAWHRTARAELDKVMPSALLEPLVAAYDELNRTVASLTTASLVEALEGVLAQVRSEVQRLEPARLIGDLSSALREATAVVQNFAPDQVFAPLVAEFDRITSVLDRFDPATLFAPLGRLFARLTAPLDALTDDDARRVGELFAPLVGLSVAFDPRINFETVAAKTTAARRLLQPINIGRLIAEIKPSYDSMVAAFEAGGRADALASRVQALNPLQSQAMTRLAERFQAAHTRLQSAFPETVPPEDLAARFAKIRPRLEELVPEWTRQTPTAASIRQAVEWANPANLSGDLASVYDAIKTQWRALDPHGLAQGLQEAHRHIVDGLAALDPAALAGRLQGLVQDILDRLGSLSIQTVAGEVQNLESDLRAVLGALDPRPIIQRLDALVSEVKALFDELAPGALLSGLREPLDAVKALVREFDPASFAQALQPIFAEVQDLLSQIDITVLLEPITNRLQSLRGDLVQALQRTERAFDSMLAAIPL